MGRGVLNIFHSREIGFGRYKFLYCLLREFGNLELSGRRAALREKTRRLDSKKVIRRLGLRKWLGACAFDRG